MGVFQCTLCWVAAPLDRRRSDGAQAFGRLIGLQDWRCARPESSRARLVSSGAQTLLRILKLWCDLCTYIPNCGSNFARRYDLWPLQRCKCEAWTLDATAVVAVRSPMKVADSLHFVKLVHVKL